MIKQIKNEENEDNWIDSFVVDFKKRFIALLSKEFAELDISLCLQIIDPKIG